MSENKSVSLMQMAQYVNAIEEALIEQAENNEGEVDIELSAAADMVKEIAIPDKIDRYSFVLDNLEAQEKEWKLQAERRVKVANAIGLYRERLKLRIREAMELMKVDEIQGFESKFKMVAAKSRVIIDDETKIPGGHIEIVQTKKIKKDSIYEDLKAGIPVNGAHLEESKYVKKSLNKKVLK